MKKIILLSDGTGNGAAKRHRTNIWRLYRALDLHRPDQVAYYDDGVGAQEFLPLKIVGGALGWGLERNVKELYKFLCRTYEKGQNGEEDDVIYLFGFSRGAFTVRVLAGLISKCGLCTEFSDEEDLGRKVDQNYSAFRLSFKSGWLYQIWRFLSFSSDQPVTAVEPKIEFIGVWDTVDAYGLPIDELAVLWDRLVFPIRFPDRELSPKVKRACHAVSVDDERLTFHPVLWNERGEAELAAKKTVKEGRIEQVWFSGVHSDVGGGYPMNDLSLVTLDWMMTKVEAAEGHDPGLHFIAPMRRDVLKHSDWNGKQHDSRAGLASYYRYKPRNIAQLCNDPENEVWIETPKIHRAVFERIKGNAVAYAPSGLPATYKVETTRGETPSYETPQHAENRAKELNHALDIVYWRRWLYTALLATTATLLASRFFLDWTPGGACVGEACLLDPLLGYAMALLPDLVGGWFEALRQFPTWLWGFLATFLTFFLLKRQSTQATLASSMAAWANLKGKPFKKRWEGSLTAWLRERTQSKFRVGIKRLAAGLAFVLILALLAVVAAQATFHARATLGDLCESGSMEDLEASSTGTFNVDDPCHATGLKLTKGRTYRFEVGQGEWLDGTVPATPDGINLGDLEFGRSWPFYLWSPLRRHFSQPYFKLMGRIDDAGAETFAIGGGCSQYTASSDGELFLYVNDAVIGFALGDAWALPYYWKLGKNSGIAAVTVTPVTEADCACKDKASANSASCSPNGS